MFRVTIDKTNLPYKFQLNIKSVLYDFIISYNQTYDFFTVTLVKDGEVLIEAEKAVLNQALFNNLPERPEATVGIYGINEDVIELTYDNLNLRTAFVYLENE